jgi:hypothetical protein
MILTVLVEAVVSADAPLSFALGLVAAALSPGVTLGSRDVYYGVWLPSRLVRRIRGGSLVRVTTGGRMVGNPY